MQGNRKSIKEPILGLVPFPGKPVPNFSGALHFVEKSKAWPWQHVKLHHCPFFQATLAEPGVLLAGEGGQGARLGATRLREDGGRGRRRGHQPDHQAVHLPVDLRPVSVLHFHNHHHRR